MAQVVAVVAPSSPRSRGIEFPVLKYKQQKEEAIARLQESGIPRILEELLNKVCKVNPDDLFGYMAEHFHSLSKDPVISSLSATEGLDGNSKRSVEVDLYCTVCGVEKLISRTSLSVDPYIAVPESVASTPTKGSGKKHKGGSSRSSPANSSSRIGDAAPALGLPAERKVNCVDTVRLETCKALKGLPVRKQHEVDQVLDTLRIKAAADKVILEPNSLLAVSCAVALAGSELSSHPLFLYLSPCRVPQSSPSPTPQASGCSLKVAEDGEADHEGKYVHSRSRGLSLPIPPPPSHPPQQYSVPLPVAAMLGQSTGKLKVREFCVCPLPKSPVPQQLKMLERLYYELGKVVAAKLGAGSRVTAPNGAYSSALDKLDQGVDLIKEATVSSGFQFNVDIAVLIDVGADVLYDEDKAKYEIMTGHWKTADELINMYSDLVLHANSGVLGFIDPLHPKDVTGWKKLIEKLGSKCLIVADSALQKGLPVVMQDKEQPRPSVQGADGSIKVEREDGSKVDTEMEEDRIDRLSCAAMTWKNSLSSTMDKIEHFKGCCLYMMLTAPPNLTVNTVLIDLAVASQCKFIRLGAPAGMVNLLLNRLLRIYEELVSRRLLEPTQSISFYPADCQRNQ